METLTPYAAAVLVWFAIAALAEIFSTLGFAFWLHRRGVGLVFGLIGVPGYIEHRYAQWCRDTGRSARRGVTLRLLLLVNLIVAFVFAFPILAA
jgi:type IV secretory pathway TraG/TraD family ATPase VirD4